MFKPERPPMTRAQLLAKAAWTLTDKNASGSELAWANLMIREALRPPKLLGPLT